MLRVSVVLLLLPWVAGADETTAVLRGGVYTDSDSTQVIRSLVSANAALGEWRLSAREAVDIVSSASMDVKTSPALDAMSSASSVSMSDQRAETTLGVGHDDGAGHVIGVSGFYAHERDFVSAGGALRLAWDLAQRNTTLFVSGSYAHNAIGSIMDASFARTMGQLGFGLGVAQVLGESDALRLRYDGEYLDGYQASPYRNVRFGDWTMRTVTSGGRHGTSTIVFDNTLGPATGLPEVEPTTRLRHAVVTEWVHALGDDVGLLAQARLARDDWGVRALTVGVEVRTSGHPWQLRAGYRFYLQGAADFFQDKYTQSSDSYTFYTADKELGDEVGHLGNLDAAYLFDDERGALDLRLEVFHYSYPGFPLIESRWSAFVEAGLRLSL
jgi:hypothetical protein